MKIFQKRSFCTKVSILLIISVFFVQGSNIEICDDVRPPDLPTNDDNCSLVCNIQLQHAMSNVKTDEHALCIKNSSIAVRCNTHTDCRQYHVGADCKGIPCLCKTATGNYVWNLSTQVPNLKTCIVSSRFNPDLPLVPFPWRTLLIVCGIVLALALFLICARYVSPFVRSMKRKHSARNRNIEHNTVQDDGNTLFPAGSQLTDTSPFTYYFIQSVPRIYRANPRRSYRASRIRYATCSNAESRSNASNNTGNQDKPPPYEAAVQMPPPAYDDVGENINETSNVQLNISQPARVTFTIGASS